MPDNFTIQQVAQLVAVSPNFTKDEASEWLRLVPLMNDQQLREVTRILRAMAGENAKGDIASNVPVVPQLGAFNPPAVSQGQAFGQSNPPIPSFAGTQDVAQILQSMQGQGAGEKNASPVIGQLERAGQDVATEQAIALPQQLAGVAEHQITTLEDVSLISPMSLRAWGEEGLFTALKSLAGEYSWPVVRLEFEQSPLFKSYVDTGRESLGASADDAKQHGTLERHEFEAVADLLQRLAAV